MNRKIAKREAEILRLAFVDPLTHLANRVGLIKETAKLHATSHESGSVAIEMIDIEHLQHINDGLGYSVGDQVINEVAQRSRRLAAPDEVTARIDGGLSAWLLHGASDTLIAARMRELVEHFANNATIIADHAIDITVRVGWALSQATSFGNDEGNAFFRRAEIALQVARVRQVAPMRHDMSMDIDSTPMLGLLVDL